MSNESEATSSKDTEKSHLYSENERVLCFHGPLIYEAKILERQWMENDPDFQGPYYFVHYKGWKRTWDEWVPQTRVLRWTDTNLKMQQKLKELYSQNQHSSKKRPRDSSTEKEEEYLRRPEVRLDIPDTLKGQLVDDWENVTKNQQLVTLPRNPSIREIFKRYKQYKLEKKGNREVNEELLDEVLQGIMEYFNKALGTILLYRFERHQYANMRKRQGTKELVDVYGAEHLLRLFVQMPSLIAHTDMDSEAVGVLVEHMHDILKYLQKMQRQLFLCEYENASPDYVSLTYST